MIIYFCSKCLNKNDMGGKGGGGSATYVSDEGKSFYHAERNLWYCTFYFTIWVVLPALFSSSEMQTVQFVVCTIQKKSLVLVRDCLSVEIKWNYFEWTIWWRENVKSIINNTSRPEHSTMVNHQLYQLCFLPKLQVYWQKSIQVNQEQHSTSISARTTTPT